MIRTRENFRNYWVHRAHATGGMASVYLALEPTHFRFVALKTLLEELWDEEEHRSRFLREIRIQRQLHHPNLVRFLDGEASPESCFIAMEFIRGTRLDSLLDTLKAPLPFPEAMRIFEALTAALFHAHSKEIIHRDLQPRNIILDPSDGIRLFDFGIARSKDDLLKTRTGTIMGTFAYSSPEQNQGKEVDERSDLYSLGLLIFELVTGERAIQGSSLLEITETQLRREIPEAEAFRLDIPPELNTILRDLTRRFPEDRPISARHLLDRLLQLRASAQDEERELLYPSHPRSDLDGPRRLLFSGKAKPAAEKIERVLEAHPDYGPGWLLALEAANQLQNPKKVQLACQRALEAGVPREFVLPDTALALYRLGKRRDARETLERFLELHPDDPFGQGALGLFEVLEEDLAARSLDAEAASTAHLPTQSDDEPAFHGEEAPILPGPRARTPETVSLPDLRLHAIQGWIAREKDRSPSWLESAAAWLPLFPWGLLFLLLAGIFLGSLLPGQEGLLAPPFGTLLALACLALSGRELQKRWRQRQAQVTLKERFPKAPPRVVARFSRGDHIHLVADTGALEPNRFYELIQWDEAQGPQAWVGVGRCIEAGPWTSMLLLESRQLDPLEEHDLRVIPSEISRLESRAQP